MKLKVFLTALIASFGLWAQEYTPVGSKCDTLLINTYYRVCYNENHRQANWAAHWLTSESIQGSASRTNDFREDTRLARPVLKTDFSKTGYDRGHLVPAGDMKISRSGMSETFLMSNMSPQNPRFNQGIWASLENAVRSMVLSMGSAYVITAPILEAKLPRIKSGVSIPRRYYKIAYFKDAGIMRAYLIENMNQNGSSYQQFQVTVDEVEQETGLDFFSQLPDNEEEAMESVIN